MGDVNRDYEVIIVGGGPAGLCAGMYTGRGMLKTAILERGMPGGELLQTEWIEDYPGFLKVKGFELAQKMAEHATHFGAEILQFEVESIRKRETDQLFEVATTAGTTFEAPAVVLTAGGTPLKLGVPGELEYAGRGVSYCAVCDGAFFKGEIIAVVGGGDAAVEEADYLTRYAEKVYIIHRRDSFRASKIVQARAFANPKIEVIWNTQVLAMTGEPAGLRHLALENTVTGERSTLAATGCFVFIGFKPNSHLVAQHVSHDPQGYLLTDDRMMTSIPGLWAAGDVRVQLVKQVTTAVGDGTTAAIAIEKYLTERRQAAAATA